MTEATSLPWSREHAYEEAQTELTAYGIGLDTKGLDTAPMPIIAAPREREWMEETIDRFANRCLPLLMANQSGWVILSSHTVAVTWNGGDSASAMSLEFLDGESPYPAISVFGYGILTWTIPYLVRTSPNWNLLVRGPANLPVSGASPLEGLVETDWVSSTFTMNWKLTHAGQTVVFAKDSPICMILPQRRGELESIQPRNQSLWSPLTPAPIRSQLIRWIGSRHRFLREMGEAGSEASRRRWQRHYFRGMSEDGTSAPAHQTKRSLRDFIQVRKPTLEQ